MNNWTAIWEALLERRSQGVGIVSTAGMMAAVILLRIIIGRAIRRNESLDAEVRRRWLVQLRNGAMLLIFLGTVVIWAEELRVMAVSLFAVAVATVIATKELILCVSGSVLKTIGRGFVVGDRIEIHEFRGDVIDHNALTTTILEIGPRDLTQQHTGRAVVLPNSMFLDKAVINETYTDDYVLHVFKVPIKMNADWEQAERDLIVAAKEQCGAFLDDARRHFHTLGREQGLTTLSVEPRVSVLVLNADELELVVRIAVPARKKGRIEQAILRRFVTALVARRAVQEESPLATIRQESNEAVGRSAA